MTRRPYPQVGDLFGSLKALRAIKKEITEPYGAVHTAEYWQVVCIRCGDEREILTKVMIHGDVTCNRPACVEVSAATTELAGVEFGAMTGDRIAEFTAAQAAGQDQGATE